MNNRRRRKRNFIRYDCNFELKVKACAAGLIDQPDKRSARKADIAIKTDSFILALACA